MLICSMDAWPDISVHLLPCRKASEGTWPPMIPIGWPSNDGPPGEEALALGEMHMEVEVEVEVGAHTWNIGQAGETSSSSWRQLA